MNLPTTKRVAAAVAVAYFIALVAGAATTNWAQTAPRGHQDTASQNSPGLVVVFGLAAAAAAGWATWRAITAWHHRMDRRRTQPVVELGQAAVAAGFGLAFTNALLSVGQVLVIVGAVVLTAGVVLVVVGKVGELLGDRHHRRIMRQVGVELPRSPWPTWLVVALWLTGTVVALLLAALLLTALAVHDRWTETQAVSVTTPTLIAIAFGGAGGTLLHAGVRWWKTERPWEQPMRELKAMWAGKPLDGNSRYVDPALAPPNATAVQWDNNGRVECLGVVRNKKIRVGKAAGSGSPTRCSRATPTAASVTPTPTVGGSSR